MQQWHLVGGKDDNVPEAVNRRYFDALRPLRSGATLVSIMPAAGQSMDLDTGAHRRKLFGQLVGSLARDCGNLGIVSFRVRNSGFAAIEWRSSW